MLCIFRALTLSLLLLCLLLPVTCSAHLRWDAAGSRRAAERYVQQRQFKKASAAYRDAAAIYRQRGDVNAAKVLENQAERYDADIRLFYERPAVEGNPKPGSTLKRLEPFYGAYLGAFIDREDEVKGRYLDENGQLHKDSAEFNRKIGRNHAVFFMYARYGNPFPTRWTEHLKRNHAAAQLVWSPTNLDQVQDNRYLHEFARQAGRSGIPIFLRFAGEMNGNWVPYHGDPARYIDKFRLVARVFHEETRNVALVWCVGDIPEHNIASYYPGEAAVDWVGVNFYSVLYNNNDLNYPAWWRNPADSLRYVYRTYSSRHPIMIGEWAATHFGKVDAKNRPDFAVAKIAQLYSALPRLYPRVKAVHWFSMNNLIHALPGRQLNNYSLLEEPEIAAKYAELAASPYFLERVLQDSPARAEAEIVPLSEGTILSRRVSLSAWARCYNDEKHAIIYYVAGKKVSISAVSGTHDWILDTRTLANGPALLRAEVIDGQGKVAAQQTVRVVVRN